MAALKQHSTAGLDVLVAKAKAEEDALQSKVRAERKQRWKDWVDEAWKENQRGLYKWVRQGATVVPPTPARSTPDGWVCGAQGRLDDVEAAWWAFWERPAAADELQAADDLMGPLRQLGHYPDRHQLSPAKLRSVAHGVAKSKAPGPDGWSAGHMRHWTATVWRRVYHVCDFVQ